MPTRRTIEHDGTSIASVDFGGHGANVLLLHGLAGHAGEWNAAADLLVARSRVVALDARGMGRSTRRPDDVSQEAHAADAARVLTDLDAAPAVVVGQSLGALSALLLAASWPDLVRGLVMVDAGPAALGDHAAQTANVADLRDRLARWPAPFDTVERAAEFFGGGGVGDAWAAGLEWRPDGLRPRFDADVLAETLAAATSRDYWSAWESITCPVRVLQAGKGELSEAQAAEMRRRGRDVRVVEVASAGHDVHLEEPSAVEAAVLSLIG